MPQYDSKFLIGDVNVRISKYRGGYRDVTRQYGSADIDNDNGERII